MIGTPTYKIREWRAYRGLTCRTLAEKAGMFHPQIVRYEQGQNTPRPENAGRAAEALGITVFDLRQYPKPQAD